jgi:tetratricopeptide (TPR) repeat protein
MAARDDELFERLLGEFVDRLNAGESIDREAILNEHPELGPDLLREIETFEEFKLPERTLAGAALQPLGTLGDYTLRRQIGRGGMGVVYEAWQNSLDRQVALKVLPAGIAADDMAFHRFMREAKIAGKLSHPHVVGVYGMGVEQNTPYFAMEFVEGETLAQVLAKHKASEPESETPFGKKDSVVYFAKLAEAFADVADGLQHAHSKGIIHRDIKPSNLILDNAGRLRILDFGLARLEGQESLTISGDIVGTPQYMSPEQARRKKIPVDHRTDVYSLGATMYEALCGLPPFRGKDHADTLSQIIERDPGEPRELNPRVPNDLETIVLKCLRKEPGDRYGTAEALGQDLRRFVSGAPVEARPEGAWERLARRIRRQWARLAAASVLLVLLIVIGWLAWSQARERHLRGITDYPGMVLRALEKLQAGSLRLKAESGETLSIDPQAGVFGTPWLKGLTGSVIDPVREAVSDLGEAIACVPNRPDAWYYRARARYLGGDLAGALADLDGALRVSPSFVPASMLQAAIQGLPGDNTVARRRSDGVWGVTGGWQVAWLSARKAMAEKRWQDAAKAYGVLMDLGAAGREPYIGATIESCIGRAGAQLELKDTVGALQHIAVARYLWPASVEAALLEGKAFWLSGDAEKAEQIFQRTHNAAPYRDEVAIAVVAVCLSLQAHDRALAWAGQVHTGVIRERFRAAILLDTGRCEESLEAARSAIACDPRDAYARIRLAITLYDCMGRYEEAIVEFERAGDLIPESSYLRFHQGRCFWFWHKLEQAIEQYRRAIELDPTNAIAQADLALVLLMHGKHEEGELLLRSAAEKDPWNPYVHNDRAIGFELLGHDRKALEACNDAIRANPELSWAYARRGRIFEKEGRLPEAIEEFRRACPLTPRELSHYQSLGRLLEATGRPREAFVAYLEALGLGKVHAWTHRRIARLLQTHGIAVAGEEVGKLSKLLDKRLEKVLGELDEAEAAGRADEGLIASLVWLLQSLQAIRGSDQSRVALVPRLAPYAAIDALLGFDSHPTNMESPSTSSRAAYLEARLLEKSGKGPAAAATLTQIVSIDPTNPEPAIAVATCLRPDDPARAESELRKALAVTTSRAKVIWDLWAAIGLKDLGRDPADLLESFPLAASAAATYGEDLRWLLERLRDGVPIRINCGGEDWIGPDGRAWSRDRFFTAGKETMFFVGDISRTDADALYHSQRQFPEELAVPGGYRLPVPPGRYRVWLHFAEDFWRIPGARRFDIRIEGEEIRSGFEPFARGFAAAVVEPFIARVDDGLLEIELVPVADAAAVAAIEIELAP